MIFSHWGHQLIGQRRKRRSLDRSFLGRISPPRSHAPHPLSGDDPKLPRRTAKKSLSLSLSDIRKINQKCRMTEPSLFDRRQERRGEDKRRSPGPRSSVSGILSNRKVICPSPHCCLLRSFFGNCCARNCRRLGAFSFCSFYCVNTQ